MDHIRQTGEKTQFFPPKKHPPYLWHILARQSVKHRGPVRSQPSKHVHFTQTAQAALAGACLPHGGWPHPKRNSLWRVGIWKEIQRPPTAALQGCLQERHESLAADRMMWRSTLSQHLKSGEEKLVNAEVGKGACTKERKNSNRPETTHNCYFCGRDCFSHIGLYSHKHRCNNRTDRTTKMYSHDQT